MRNRLAVSGYGDGLSVLDRPEEFGQARLGFSSLNLTHVWLQPVVLTIPYYQVFSTQVNNEGALRAFVLNRRAASGNRGYPHACSIPMYGRLLALVDPPRPSLNVAMTRARSEMIVFSTLEPDQIDLSRSTAAAVRDLKHFLDYAENEPSALRSAVFGPIADFESSFEESGPYPARDLTPSSAR